MNFILLIKDGSRDIWSLGEFHKDQIYHLSPNYRRTPVPIYSGLAAREAIKKTLHFRRSVLKIATKVSDYRMIPVTEIDETTRFQSQE